MELFDITVKGEEESSFSNKNWQPGKKNKKRIEQKLQTSKGHGFDNQKNLIPLIVRN